MAVVKYGINRNMYEWVSHRWNPIRGRCPYQCSYCYMKRWKNTLDFPMLHVEDLKDDLGQARVIFVGTGIDMFAVGISSDWILAVLSHVAQYPDNVYIFQTKNPERYHLFMDLMPANCILGTTIECEYATDFSCAPSAAERAFEMGRLSVYKDEGIVRKTFVTVEPVIRPRSMDVMVALLEMAEPDFVNIGADSGNNKLPEPDHEDLILFIKRVEKFAHVWIKDNLSRILEEPYSLVACNKATAKATVCNKATAKLTKESVK